MLTIEAICKLAPVIPVIVIEKAEDGVPLARALVGGGLKAIEITLRTPVALDAMRHIRAEVREAVVGAGTILDGDDLDAARRAGAQFGVSPGTTPSLVAAVRASGLPFLPGAATASEVMALTASGFDVLKFFPAEAAGGVATLKALHGPFERVRFCPTGGVGAGNAAAYLALPNVIAVGGSWVAPAAAIRSGRYDEITALARAAAIL
jgi:2-dehydro-3-deoxyphosphogluconate aldolase/(4S)-4-hydroxy-2-oxoglutarate aldolase